MMSANVDTELRHRLDGKWMDVARGVRAGTSDSEMVIECGAENTLGEVGAATVTGAEDEDGRWHGRSGWLGVTRAEAKRR